MNDNEPTNKYTDAYGRCDVCRVLTAWNDLKEVKTPTKALTACQTCAGVTDTRLPVSERSTLGCVAEYIEKRQEIEP